MKVIILVAGYGTRMLNEITSQKQQNLLIDEIRKVTKEGVGVAKTLIPIKGQPVVWHLLIKLLVRVYL